jgi:hypothetical protein
VILGQGVVISLQGVMIAHHGIVIFLETADRQVRPDKVLGASAECTHTEAAAGTDSTCCSSACNSRPWLLAATGPVTNAGVGGYVGTSMTEGGFGDELD